MTFRMSFLDPDQIADIHETALAILETTGMLLPCTDMLQCLRDAGAQVEGDVARFPRQMVRGALASLPKREDMVIYGRDGSPELRMSERGPLFLPMVEALDVVDLESGKRRPAESEDLRQMVRLCDALPEFDVVGPGVSPSDVPHETVLWHSWATCLKNTRKHITSECMTAECVRDVVRMCAAISGSEQQFRSRPYVSIGIVTNPPLRMVGPSIEALMETVKSGIPLIVTTGPMAGATSPVTIAGTLAVAHAEHLGAVVMSQTVRPGSTLIVTAFARMLDMKTGTVSMGGPERAILCGGLAELGHHVGLPVETGGLLRDSVVLDAQAGFETGVLGFAALTTADFVMGCQLDADLLVDLADLVFCNEVVSYLRRLLRGLDVNERTLALGLVKETGPGNSFLSSEHTLQNFRGEVWQPELFFRGNRRAWEKRGEREVREVALDKVRALLAREAEPLVSETASREIDRIVAEADARAAERVA